MRRNVAGQSVSAVLQDEDRNAVTTGTTTVYVTKDGTRTAGGGVVSHKGQGEWQYVATQGETDAVHAAFLFVNALGFSACVNVYPLAKDSTGQVEADLSDSALDDVQDVVDQALDDSDTLQELAQAVAELATQNAGDGARTVTVTVDDGTDPIGGARVRLTSGATTRVLTTATSGPQLGTCTFNVDDNTWTVAITADGHTFAGASLIVDGDETPTYSMTAVPITPPPSTATSTGWCVTHDGRGLPQPNVKLTFRMTDPYPATDDEVTGKTFQGETFSTTSDGDSYLEDTFKRLAAYEVRRGLGDWVPFTVPDADSFPLPELLLRETKA